ncbi:Thiol-disulfide oxidoreductase ResA [subsurface metagenome]
MSFILINSCKIDNNKNDYLQKVIDNLDQIESATYFTTSSGYAPGDTSAYVTSYQYFKEYSNPTDTTIGSSYVSLLQEDTTKMTFCYDGNMRAIVYEDIKILVIDSFKLNNLPFRPLNPPFFNYTKSIIKYALETKDSITIGLIDLGDSVHLSLAIYGDKQVEFFGKPYHIDNPFSFGDEVSKYDIWINKSNDLPYRIRREMSHDISVQTCRNVEFNKNNIEDFIASKYFPSDFTIRDYRKRGSATPKDDLVGKVAPDWVLKDVNNNIIALEKLKSKVVMIQFTSVSCGPCRASIPFLKQLVTEFNENDFDFVSIENLNRNSNVLKGYQGRNDFNYKFLMSTDDVNKSYQVKAVPVFYILDEKRVIRKVIGGYGPGTTDKEIRDAINELI